MTTVTISSSLAFELFKMSYILQGSQERSLKVVIAEKVTVQFWVEKGNLPVIITKREFPIDHKSAAVASKRALFFEAKLGSRRWRTISGVESWL